MALWDVVGRRLWTTAHWAQLARFGPICTLSRPVGGAATCARLLADRTGFPCSRARRGSTTLFNGMGNGQYALRLAAGDSRGETRSGAEKRPLVAQSV